MEKQNKVTLKLLKLLYVILVVILTLFGIYLFGVIPFLIEAVIMVFIPVLITRKLKVKNTFKIALILVLPLILWIGARIYIASENRRLQLESIQLLSKATSEKGFGADITLPSGWINEEDKYDSATYSNGDSNIIFEKQLVDLSYLDMDEEALVDLLNSQSDIYSNLDGFSKDTTVIDGLPTVYIKGYINPTEKLLLYYFWSLDGRMVYHTSFIIADEHSDTIMPLEIIKTIQFK